MGAECLIRPDAIDRDAVVCRKDQQLRFVEARLEGALHHAKAHRQRLQLAQGAAGVAAKLQLRAQGLFKYGVGGGRVE